MKRIEAEFRIAGVVQGTRDKLLTLVDEIHLDACGCNVYAAQCTEGWSEGHHSEISEAINLLYSSAMKASEELEILEND